jgi:hypothetical protein
MKIKLAMVLVFVLLGYPAFLISEQVLSENVDTKPIKISALQFLGEGEKRGLA